MTEENLIDKPLETLKPNIQRRLEFIDFRLLWNGKFNRKDLSDTFQISSQQASADIASYEQRAPNNLGYDNAIKAYIRTETFNPVFLSGTPNRYLLQLVGIQSGWLSQDDTWFETPPPALEVVELKRQPITSVQLQCVLDAIREKLEIDIEYRSINSAVCERRWIAPHAMSYNSGRWYVRAWSEGRNDFRDFNIYRIIKVFGKRQSVIDINLDYEWNNFVDMKLAPNPALSQESQRAVKEEYNITGEYLVKNIRLSLVFYLMNEYNLDVEEDKLNPHKQQLVLLNKDEIENARRVARKMSEDALKRIVKS